MKKPTFIQGVGVALLLATGGGILFTVLTPAFHFSWVLKLISLIISGVYLLYLMSCSTSATGRFSAFALWLVVSTTFWLWQPGIMLFLLLEMTLMWLIRCWFFHSSIVPSLMDLGIQGTSLIALLWAIEQTGSIFIAIWSFFLVQALFVAIPQNLKSQNSGRNPTIDNRFMVAHKSAELAIKRLATQATSQP